MRVKAPKSHVEAVINELKDIIYQLRGDLFKVTKLYNQEIIPEPNSIFQEEAITQIIVRDILEKLNSIFKQHRKYLHEIADRVSKKNALIVDLSRIQLDFSDITAINLENMLATIRDGKKHFATDIISYKISMILSAIRNHTIHSFTKLFKAARLDAIKNVIIIGNINDVQYYVLEEFVRENHDIIDVRLFKNVINPESPYALSFIKVAMTSKSLFILDVGTTNEYAKFDYRVIGLQMELSSVRSFRCFYVLAESGMHAWFSTPNTIRNHRIEFNNLPKLIEEIKTTNKLNVIFTKPIERTLTAMDTIDPILGRKYVEQEQLFEIAIKEQILFSIRLHKEKVIRLDVMYDDWYPIDYAIMCNSIWAVIYFDFQGARYSSLADSLTSLHIAARYADAEILHFILKNVELRNIINEQDDENKTPLEICIIHGKTECVRVLLLHGANPDLNHNGKWLLYALQQKYFDIAMLLIEFNVMIGNEAHGILLNMLKSKDYSNFSNFHLKNFLEKRHDFFKAIESGDLDAVEKIIDKSEPSIIHWKDFNNQSALYVACLHKRYLVYGYLSAKHFSFDENEAPDLILNDKEGDKFKDAALNAIKDQNHTLIRYLRSKTQALGLPETVTDESLYQDLIADTLIRPLLEVSEYATPKLEVYIDGKSESIQGLVPKAGKGDKGVCYHDRSTIIIGAKKAANELKGTIAHEFTHLACLIIFKNHCLPYADNSVMSKTFHDVYMKVYEKKMNGAHLDDIISMAFENYKAENEQKCELIVRVPHILARDGHEAGLRLLQYQVPELLTFYQDYLLPACHDFIKQQSTIVPSNQRSLYLELKHERSQPSPAVTVATSNAAKSVIKYATGAAVLGFAAYGVLSFFRSNFVSNGVNSADSMPIAEYH